jgi:hypothetical protein
MVLAMNSTSPVTTQNLRKLAKLVPAPRQRHRDR